MSKKEKVKKPFYKKWWVWVIAIIVLFGIIGSIGNEEPTKKSEKVTEKDTSSYTADNVYVWLKKSGLIKGEAVDKTSEFKGNTEGVIKVIGTGEVDIHEFKTAEQAKKYDIGGDMTVAYKKIYILIIQGQSQHDSFKKVLEAGKPLTDLETKYSSDQQKQVAELMQNGSDFFPLVEAYYSLPNDQKSQTYDDFIYKKEVSWTGTIADLEAIGDSIVVYGKPTGYNGENWSTISTNKKDMLPYVFIVELKDKAMKTGLKKGEQVKVKAVVGSRGDKKLQYNWKLYEGEVIK
ncbi:hypothetical protein [Neobacillus sp. LXY-1]|uniref:hypothetical protein n=1 Tax=Neobacillus sp. LXY-1 TaxID=3379133 RepID=UPI003EE16E86